MFDYLSNRGIDTSEHSEDYYVKVLCDYLVSESIPSDDLLVRLLSEFVIEKENDDKIKMILSHLREGTIIHEGVRYCDNLSEMYSSWKGNIELYLDTEILLAIGGYNSELLQAYCKDMIQYVKELNYNASKHNRIILKYFTETYDEIDMLFRTAERIIKGAEIGDPTKEAIQQLTNGCESISELEKKRSLFFEKLRGLNINKDESDYYDFDIENNKRYNIEQGDIEDKYSKEYKWQKTDIHRSLAMLSHINILRKGKSDTGFENCIAMFITATNRTIRLSRACEIYKQSEVPLASTLDFVINRYWLRLHKGFGEGRKPRTLDMVVKARFLLSSILNDKVYNEFRKLKQTYENGEMTKDQFVLANIDLKEKLHNPEDIKIEQYDYELEEIEKWDFTEVQRRYEFDKEKLINSEKEREELSRQLELKEELYRHEAELQNKNHKKMIEEKEETTALRDRELEEKDRIIQEYEKAEKDRREKENLKKEKQASLIINLVSIILISTSVLAGIYGVIGKQFGLKYAEMIIDTASYLGIIALLGVVIRVIKKKVLEWYLRKKR